MKKEDREILKDTIKQLMNNGMKSCRDISRKLKKTGLYKTGKTTVWRIQREIKKENPEIKENKIEKVEPETIKLKPKEKKDHYIRIKCKCGFTHKLIKSNPKHSSWCTTCNMHYIREKGYWMNLKSKKKVYPHEIKIDVKEPSNGCQCRISERILRKIKEVEERLGIH